MIKQMIAISAYLVSSGLACADTDAEIKINQDHLIEYTQQSAFPLSKKVRFNPPSFCVPVENKDSKVKNLYYFRLSQDKNFSKDVIQSKGKRWSLYNPHQQLAKGTWYWQSGIKEAGSEELKWNENVREFEITGDETLFVTPSFEEWKTKLANVHPRILASPDQIGNFVPDSDEIQRFIRAAKKEVKFPEVPYFDDQDWINEKSGKVNGDKKKLRGALTKKTGEKMGVYPNTINSLLKAYILSGDEAFAKKALFVFKKYEAAIQILGEKRLLGDFSVGSYYVSMALVIDTCYQFIEVDERKRLVKILSERVNHDGMKKLHRLEYAINNSHQWQHHIRDLFIKSLILVGMDDKAERWIEYIYELWIYRAPGGMKNKDGGWIPGNGYFGANTETLALMPLWLKQFTGFDFYSDPWYQNFGKYAAFSQPFYETALYGDHTRINQSNKSMAGLVNALRVLKDDPWLELYYSNKQKYTGGKLETLPLRRNFNWHMMRHIQSNKKHVAPPTKTKNVAAVFRDTGLVAMHTDLQDSEKNTLVSIRSCPVGSVGHAHAAQNAFNILYGGKRVFTRSGFYTSWGDYHTLQSYKNSRAHNTIQAGGINQKISPDGYGWIARYLHGDTLTYALADASNAYDGKVQFREGLDKQAKAWDIDISEKNGFGSAGVTKFRRHLTFIRPNIVVIYDELAAKEPISWKWQLHSWDKMVKAPSGTGVRTIVSQDSDVAKMYHVSPAGNVDPAPVYKNATGVAQVFSGLPLDVIVTDEFHGEPSTWKGSIKKVGLKKYFNHYHAAFSTKSESDQCRFLSVIRIIPPGEEESVPAITSVKKEDGKINIQIGEWTINANLKSDLPAKLFIKNKDESKALVYNKTNSPVQLKGKAVQPENHGSSILIEDSAQPSVKEAIDTAPSYYLYR